MNFGKTIAIDGQNLQEVALATDARLSLPGETEFLEKLKAGDAEAFDELVSRFSIDIYNLLARLTGDAEEAKDLTQETFLSVVRSVTSFRGEASLKTWLYRIAINQARNRQRWWRSRRFGLTFSLDSSGDESSDAASLHETLPDRRQPSPEDFAARREQEVLIREALKKLPLAFREAVVLRDIEGLSYEEIAAALETNIGTVKSRIARGREELKRKLQRSL